jgi:DNA-binding NtrC family response regulator
MRRGFKNSLEAVQKEIYEVVLRAVGFNQTRAAQALGLSQSTFHSDLKRLRLIGFGKTKKEGAEEREEGK